MQAIAREAVRERLDALFRKWLTKPPHRTGASDRAGGVRCDFSIFQAEFLPARVLDRPLRDLILFEETVRDNLDLGRPDQVQLIFDRRAARRTPSRYRARRCRRSKAVAASGLQVLAHQAATREGRVLRNETVISATRDFGIGRRPADLDGLREIGFAASRHLLDVLSTGRDCPVGADAIEGLHQSAAVEDRRIYALRFGDRRVLAVLSSLLPFPFPPKGFSSRQLRERVAAPLRDDQGDCAPKAGHL